MPEQKPLTAPEIAKQDIQRMQESGAWGNNQYGDRLIDIKNFEVATELELSILTNYIELPIWENFELQKQNIIRKITQVKEILSSNTQGIKEKSKQIDLLTDQCHNIIGSIENSNLKGDASQVDEDADELEATGTD